METDGTRNLARKSVAINLSVSTTVKRQITVRCTDAAFQKHEAKQGVMPRLQTQAMNMKTTTQLTSLVARHNNGHMKPSTTAVLFACLTSLFWLGCEDSAEVKETDPLTAGAVTARIVSSFSVDDPMLAIDLPNGLEVSVRDAANTPIADANVNIYPNGSDPIELAHQGNGLYRVDVLSGSIEDVADEYFVEVSSELLEAELFAPNPFVMRVPHEAILERPVIVAPTDRSEHLVGENLVIRWQPVEGAACYDVGVRDHELEAWTIVENCVTDTLAAIDGEAAQGFNFILVRAENEVGDQALTTLPYHSRSYSEADVRIFFVESDPEE